MPQELTEADCEAIAETAYEQNRLLYPDADPSQPWHTASPFVRAATVSWVKIVAKLIANHKEKLDANQ